MAKVQWRMGGPCRFFSGGTLDKPFSGYLLGIILGSAPIGFAVMATPRPSQHYFGHTESYLILSSTHMDLILVTKATPREETVQSFMFSTVR